MDLDADFKGNTAEDISKGQQPQDILNTTIENQHCDNREIQISRQDQVQAQLPELVLSDNDLNTDESSDSIDYQDYELPYDFNDHSVIKTADRILDDLRNSPLILLDSNGDTGILSKPTIEYASLLASKIQKPSTLKYQCFHFDPSGEILKPLSSDNLNNDETLSTIDGLVAPLTDANAIDFSKVKLLHYRIKIKSKFRLSLLKQSFHLFKDEDLNEKDHKTLISDNDQILETFRVFDDIPNDTFTSKNLSKSLPLILDCANYISRDSGTIIRIEIYKPVFSEPELVKFSLNELQTRAVTFNSKAEALGIAEFEGQLSTLVSFNKLYRCLIGPFTQREHTHKRSIKIIDTKLDVYLDISLLTEKFLFTLSEDDEINRVIFPQYFYEWGNYSTIIQDYYQRALLEIQYFIGLFDGKAKYKLPIDFDKVFDLINDYDKSNQKEAWTKWNNLYYTSDMILLSCTPKYDVYVINNMYYTYAVDDVHIPIYFDALINVEKIINNDQLKKLISMLKSQGLVGYKELKLAYQKLGFSNVATSKDMHQIDPKNVIENYRTQLALATSKYDKGTMQECIRKIATYIHSSQLTLFLQTEPFFDADDAYNLLSVTPDKEDDWILTMYTSHLNDQSSYSAVEYGRALFTVALKRRSLSLMNFISDNLPQFISFYMPIEDAYNILGLYNTADEETVIRVFQERAANDLNIDYKLLWKALEVVGNEKGSGIIQSYLKTGIIDSNLLSADKSPAGIENIGNTCYLNSLLQYYFVIKPFRDYILNFDNEFNAQKFEENNMYHKRRIGGRTVGFNETQRSFQFIHKLRELYWDLIHKNARCVVPKRELAFLAFSPIEQVVNITTKQEEINKLENNKENFIVIESDEESFKNKQGKQEQSKDDEDNLFQCTENPIPQPSVADEEMQDLTATEICVREKQVNNIDEITKAAGKTEQILDRVKTTTMISDEDYQFAIEQSGQQDVTECIQNVLAQTETAMDPRNLDNDNEQVDIIKRLFYGKTKQVLSKIDTKKMIEVPGSEKSVKIERFLNLIVSLEDHPKNIYDALDGYFRDDLLEYDNDCVKRSLTIIELPSILQIQIQRVQYDRELFRPVKCTDPLPFDQTVYMDRFMETDNESIIKKREESFKWRVRLKEIEKRLEFLTARGDNGMTIKDSLISTRSFFESSSFKQFDLSIDSSTFEVLNDQIKKIDQELADLDDESSYLEGKLAHQYDEFKKIGYKVFAAFIHRGSATYGHYWIYIRDPKKNVWRVYNDEMVSEISSEEVFNFSESNMATPYYLVYVRDTDLDSIEPLKREIIIEPEEGTKNENAKADETLKECSDVEMPFVEALD